MSDSPRTLQGRGTPGRHRDPGLPATVRAARSAPAWRAFGIRTAAGVALVVGAGVVTVVPGQSLDTAPSAVAAALVPSSEAVLLADSELSLRLDARASRSGRTGAVAAVEREVPHTQLVFRAAPAPAPVETPAPAPAPAAPAAPPAPVAPVAPVAKATPAPTATSAPAPKAAPAAASGVSFAPCAGGSGVEAGLTPDAIRVHRAVCALFPGVGSYGGLSGSGGNHSAGRAVDIMVGSSGLGAQIAAYVRANAAALGVSEVIWAQHIWTVQRSGEGWRAMPDRGSATANHDDHVHVSVYGSAGA